MTKTWYFLRHGKPVTTGILTGSKTDVAVSELGVAAMESALPKTVQFDACISSPMQRCLSFARKQSRQSNLPLVIAKQLQEMDFGDWDGRTYEWLWENTQNPSIGEFWQALGNIHRQMESPFVLSGLELSNGGRLSYQPGIPHTT
ncbi:histidine phosphatase family protein [Pseudoalteromonas phenolica]|uniref:histidine phosphatase family protein n=1 Tax=Pseudoalteromonas phenolica TaxID=161398 RepID=UPI000FFE7EE9|nr:histidine phosphatase family protein [Pseudoalteromonas phenolica]RXF03967.1 hypothetical protein D9981_04775 [Pseudoalteromonas phenolica O-BC30]